MVMNEHNNYYEGNGEGNLMDNFSINDEETNNEENDPNEKQRQKELKKKQYAQFDKKDSKRNRKMRKNTIKVCKDNYTYLHSTFTSLKHKYDNKEIKDFEFVAGYVLLYWKSRYPSNWLGGAFVENENKEITSSFDPFSFSLFVEDLPHFSLSSYQRNRIYSSMGLPISLPPSPRRRGNNNNNNDNNNDNNNNNYNNIINNNHDDNNNKNDESNNNNDNNNGEYPKISVMTIFHYFLLTGLPSYVNSCLDQWAMGNRKIKLLFDIPSSDDVFYMQSIGERCITAFIQEHELSRLLKDHYPPFEERDALSFLLHDIQHMEKFADPMFYFEQIGFCHVLRKFIKSGVWNGYEKYDKEFSEDIEHVISDMNACSVHLFSFFKSKVFLAEQRYIISNSLHLPPPLNENEKMINEKDGYLSDYQKRVVLSPIFEAWDLPPNVRKSAENISMAGTLRGIQREDTDVIRHHFHLIGNQIYSSLYPSSAS